MDIVNVKTQKSHEVRNLAPRSKSTLIKRVAKLALESMQALSKSECLN